MNKAFFDAVRAAPFGGSLTQGQVDGLTKITDYARFRGTSALHLAYILATAFHECAQWMQPIREGARRYGLNYTDKQSRRAVKSIFDKGVIRWNYALPEANGNSYYARGLVGLTHMYNYQKFESICGQPLVANPDLVLDWENSLPILFIGMEEGMFRNGHQLSGIESTQDFRAARGIINGDTRKNGSLVAGHAMDFYKALEASDYGTGHCTS